MICQRRPTLSEFSVHNNDEEVWVSLSRSRLLPGIDYELGRIAERMRGSGKFREELSYLLRPDVQGLFSPLSVLVTEKVAAEVL